ncbi:hypothetical protein [Streptomyces violaceus]|uniref:Uncharacterized protein n=1 Tax=Streptomyces violaceus TaxID=1936 RepID=A0ABY9U100_STRVL|nr:hypothetical protein [Streptomyces janthinus]WND15926.1 hypothetical protein RI060_00430 [Streptomyces janthinus]GGS98766.1 hypothetical protein GCM10010270_83450 [Streptomyces janthinus]
MLDPELLERITVRRAELDELEEQLVKQLTEAGRAGERHLIAAVLDVHEKRQHLRCDL